MLGGFVGADGFVGDVADAAFDAIVDAVMARGAEGFVIIRGYAERGAQLFIKTPQITELGDANGNFGAVVRKKKFLVAGIPQVRELALGHDRRDHGHLKAALVEFAQFRATIVFLDANHAA